MSDLDTLIRQLRDLATPAEVERKVAAKTALKVDAALRATLSGGKSAEGETWAPRKKDGGRAYEQAAAHLEVKAHGDLVRATISGPTAYGPYGVRGAPKRPMLPEGGGGIPASVDAALDAAQAEVFAELTK